MFRQYSYNRKALLNTVRASREYFTAGRSAAWAKTPDKEITAQNLQI
jgi:hypothetical protein